MKTTITALLIAASAGLVGCETHTANTQPNPPTVHVEASNTAIVAGETVTLTARTKDTYGREARVHWTSTAGSLRTEQDGRIARVTFNEPGTYTVKATLSVNGNDVQTDMVEVRVRPVG